MKKLLTYATICLLLISCAKSDEHVFLDNESVQQNDLKQQIISILGYAEEDIEFDEIEDQIFVQIKALLESKSGNDQKQRAIKCDEGVLAVYCRTTSCRKRGDYNEQYQT